MDYRLFKIAEKKITDILSEFEFILIEKSIYLIDTKVNHWILELNLGRNTLYWNMPFFLFYIQLFNLPLDSFESIIGNFVLQLNESQMSILIHPDDCISRRDLGFRDKNLLTRNFELMDNNYFRLENTFKYVIPSEYTLHKFDVSFSMKSSLKYQEL